MNSKLLLSLSVVAILITMTGCYQKHLVLQADAVSMTQTNAGDIKKLKVGSDVDEKWCIGDDLAQAQRDDDKVVGLADQVIYKAQGGGKKADFIVDARVFTDSDGCALLTGKEARL